jgi:hypothetical protein
MNLVLAAVGKSIKTAMGEGCRLKNNEQKNHSTQICAFLPLVEAVFSENNAEEYAVQNVDTDFTYSPYRPLQFELSWL